MKRFALLFAALLPLTAPAGPSSIAGNAVKNFVTSHAIDGRVVRVLDGDTADVLDAYNTLHRIRFSDIDAPEKSMPFGQRSKESLGEMIFDRQIHAECNGEDRGRNICRVFVGNVDVNLMQAKRGMAWAYRQYSKDPAIYAAENYARERQVGLWSDPNPMPPWSYRHAGGK